MAKTNSTLDALTADSRKAERIAARRERTTAAAVVVANRQTARDSRTPQQQLAELDSRLGAGVGATRERARLTAA